MHGVATGFFSDDDPPARDALTRLLEKKGIAVLTERQVIALAIEELPNKGVAHRTGNCHRKVEIRKAPIMHKTAADTLLDGKECFLVLWWGVLGSNQ